MTLVKACVAIAGVPVVHPAGHPRAGEVVEFDIRIPGAYDVEFHISSYSVRFAVDIDEDGRARMRLLEESGPMPPDGSGLTPLERELLDGLARIIARDILRRREVV